MASDSIHYTVYEPDGAPVRAAILLLHGMQEHSGRYDALANYLKGHGYGVLTYDHPGHGHTAQTKAQLGFFRLDKPDELLVDEAGRMALVLAQRFPDTKRIVMGHSMGSFVARVLLKKVPLFFHGAIFMGSGGPNPLAKLMLPVLHLANLIAPKKRSRWLNRLFLSINNRKFADEMPNDGTNWLSANLANRKAFLADALCGTDFSNNAFLGLISVTVAATRADWADGIPHQLPMLFTSGADDPIGNFGKGVEKTVYGLMGQGFERVDLKLYPHMRHEILNEDERQPVFDDLLAWLQQTIGGATAEAR